MSLALPRRDGVGRNYRHVDKCLCPDIPGGVAISVSLMPTLLATKPSLPEAISRFDMSTGRTHLRSVGRIDDLEQYACGLGLVGDKLSQLIESPTSHAVTLRLAKPYPLTDTLEVFKSYAASGVFGLRNESLGEDVIRIATKTRFSVCNAFELLADALTPAVIGGQVGRRLKGLLERLALDADFFHVFAGVKLAIGVGSEVLDAEVERPPKTGLL